MRFTVYFGADAIGVSDLEDSDSGMGVATGRFVPAAAYARVRAIFRGHAEAHAACERTPDETRLLRMYAERDALGLELRDAVGTLVATEWVHVYDYAEEAGEEEGYLLEVKLRDLADWRARHPDDPAI